jgi:DNA-directed RNA polymerase specialized sigma24 family protein
MINKEEENIAILKCQQGEIAGLEVLVRNYQLPALRIAYLLLGDYTLVEDIVQESFIAVYKGIGQYVCNTFYRT